MNDTASLDSLLGTAIPVLSNRLVLRLMQEGYITIDPFNAEGLRPTAYRLCPHRIRFHAEDEDGIPLADEVIELPAGAGRDLRPGEYAIISPRERIVLAEGLVADFYPSSWCVENKLILTAGRLDAHYEADLVFGVFNAGRSDVRLTTEFQLVRATFGWLGRANMPVYKGNPPPGAYIHELAQLRERDAALDSVEDELRRQREEVARLREDLVRKGEADGE